MSAFTEGWKLSGDLYDSGIQQRRQKVLDERAATAWEQAQQDRARQVGLRDQEDQAAGALQSLQNGGVYDGSRADFSGQSATADLGPVPQDQMAPVRGMRAPGADPTAGLSAVPSRAATGLDYNKAAQRIALAKRDMNSWGQLNDKGQILEEDDIMAKAAKGELSDDVIGGINKNHQKVTLGQADKNGILPFSVVHDNGRSMFGQLDAGQQAKLKGAFAIMDRNPTRAWEMISAVNKDLATYLKSENDTTLGAGKANNEGAYHAGTLANQRITAGAYSRYHDAMAKKAGQTKADMARDQIDEYTVTIQAANLGMPVEVARKQAADVILKNPNTKDVAPKVNADGSITKGDQVFVPDSKRPGQYVQVQFPGMPKLDQAIDRDMKGGKPAAQAPGTGMPPPRPAGGSKQSAKAPPSLSQALGMPSNGGALDRAMAGSMGQIQMAGDAVHQAQAILNTAARSNDPVAIRHYSQIVQQASDQLETLLGTMNPQQAAQVRQALGI